MTAQQEHVYRYTLHGAVSMSDVMTQKTNGSNKCCNAQLLCNDDTWGSRIVLQTHNYRFEIMTSGVISDIGA